VAVATDFERPPTEPQAAIAVRRRPSFWKKAWAATWPKLLAIAIVVGVWQICVWLKLRPEYVVPSPFTVFDAMIHDWHQLLNASVVTLKRGAWGFLVAMLIGGAVGIAVARVSILRAAIGSMITGLQTMPSVAWVPLAIILFHQGTGVIMFVVVLGAAPSIANGIIDGIDHVPPILLRAGRVLGARGFTSLRLVVIPAALPSVVSGLKQGWAFAWRSLMAAELISLIPGHVGIGQLLNTSGEQLDFVGVFEAMIMIFIIGVMVDALFFGTADRAIRRRYGLIDAAGN
jgi:NitT/TauT family transport system permease protein